MSVHHLKPKKDEAFWMVTCDECGEPFDPDDPFQMRPAQQYRPYSLPLLHHALAEEGWLHEERIEEFHEILRPYTIDICKKCVKGVWP